MSDRMSQPPGTQPFLLAFAESGPPPYRLEGEYNPATQTWDSPAGTVRRARTQFATNPATTQQTNGWNGADTNLDSGHDVDFD